MQRLNRRPSAIGAFAISFRDHDNNADHFAFSVVKIFLRFPTNPLNIPISSISTTLFFFILLFRGPNPLTIIRFHSLKIHLRLPDRISNENFVGTCASFVFCLSFVALAVMFHIRRPINNEALLLSLSFIHLRLLCMTKFVAFQVILVVYETIKKKNHKRFVCRRTIQIVNCL